MKNSLIRALLAGSLAFSMSVIASEQVNVSTRDRAWMKQQQDDLQAFKDTLSAQSYTLPQAQQNMIDRLQQGIAAQQPGAEQKTFPAIYFVSLGIPPEGLLPMLKDANRFSIPATIRGLLNNDFRATAAAMFSLSKEDKNTGVQIDPTLFSDYHITAVPALVVTCPGHYDVIRGSLPLQQALEKVAEKGDCASTARQLLEAAR
ncbi:type-F conjugative transfer system pilin assembly protein TrbC [Kosakonia pseudosacchari]|uniref:Type-F conjugative transfer system pilin assembly protein TrbC n=1 Tax=Kosakonia pseudosacchari TaxID=1646340 RepID=A0ABX4IKG7_9ENTR|nr:type-F conjugative transfer system pilin assembly protein TrbC [Kosakonia pseudosacchari]PDO82759.1 type-F conjugative transfer system pilin assembly protein TrbC [Kosakonia pseudosacchari]